MLFRSLALLPLAIGSIAAEAVNFDGHQAFRVMTDGDSASVSKKLSEINYNKWNDGKSKDHIDISMPGEDVEKFKKMGLRFKEMHKDLGKDIREEKKYKPYPGKLPADCSSRTALTTCRQEASPRSASGQLV